MKNSNFEIIFKKKKMNNIDKNEYFRSETYLNS